MALVKCTKCGKEFSSTLDVCPHCGHNINSKQIVCPECGCEYSDELDNCPKCGMKTKRTTPITIYGYKEPFATNPATDIYIEGKKVGSVPRAGKTEIEIDHDCIIEFRCSMRTTQRAVKVGQKEQIMLSFNRTTGALSAMNTTAETYAQDSINAKEKDKNKMLWTAIFVIALIILALILAL